MRGIASRALRYVRQNRSPMPHIIGHAAYRELRRTPPMTPGIVRIFDRDIAYSDVNGLLHSLRELFVDEVYRFNSDAVPHIIDAGANIGLSILYFKSKFPAATIVAYEPDPQMFALLEHNVAGLDGIELHNSAAWTEETELTFYREGSLAGSTEVDFLRKGQTTIVKTERLRSKLEERPVDFLKIDIEGAENEVLFDIEPALDRVGLLFFEYHSSPSRAQRLGDMLTLVTRKGFRYAINGAHCATFPFTERREHGFDLQLNISCVR